MKNSFAFLLFCMLFLTFHTNAQDRNHELGIRMTDLVDFGFIYKKSDDGVKFKRYRLAAANFSATFTDDPNIGVDLSFARGVEKRKNVAAKLQFIHGWEPGIFINFRSVNETIDFGVGGFLGYVLGFQYNFSPQFYINIETIPSFSILANFIDDDDVIFSSNLGFNSNALALTMAYAFTAPKK